jgi:hypothetical protein
MGKISKYFSLYWVEERHDFLKSMPPEDAKSLVDSLDGYEIEANVNYRRFQEDYIADFLEYLWALSKASFWKHIATALEHPDGLIFSDNMGYLKIIKEERMPKYVFKRLLIAIRRMLTKNVDELSIINLELELLVDIINCKLYNHKEAVRLKPLYIEWFTNLNSRQQKVVMDLIKKVKQ